MNVRHNTYAINKNEQCVIASKTSREEGTFKCLLCKEPLILRAGEKNIPHFAHLPDSPCKGGDGNGGGESEEHCAAKRLVADNIRKIQIYVTCAYKGCVRASDLWEECLFKEHHVAVMESMLGRHRVDVCVRDTMGLLKAVVEIAHTHPTEPEKVTALYDYIGYPHHKKYVVEVRASEVLAYLEEPAPLWRLENMLTHRHCDGCFVESKQEEMRLQHIPRKRFY